MNILPTMVQEAVGQCKKQGFVVSAALAAFYMRTQLLSAKKDPQNNVEVTPPQVEELVSGAVRTLTLADSALLETFKLQASVTTTQQEQVNARRTERVQRKAKSARLLEDVLAKETAGAELTTAIVLFALHESGTALNDEEAQREALAALDLVFTRELLDSFVSQRDTQKTHQLNDVWRIICGIRLFSRSLGAGGAGLPDHLPDTKARLEAGRAGAMRLTEEAAAVAAEYHSVLSNPSLGLQPEARFRLLDEYHHRLQLQVYAQSLVTTFDALQEQLAELEPSFLGVLAETRDLVPDGDMRAVPKSTLLPKFLFMSERYEVLAEISQGVADGVAVLDVVSSFVAPYTATLRPADVDQALASKTADVEPVRAAIAAEVAQCQGVAYHDDLPPNAKSAMLEFNGFCVVSLVEDGVVAEGRRHRPLCPGFVQLQANGAYYSFSSARALKAFARDPFRYLAQGFMDQVAANSALIYLIGLQAYIPRELYLTGSRKHEAAGTAEKGNGGTQTGHIDDYKDTHYVWNEWELRRLALRLAALRTKRTKSTQTGLSHYRRDNDTQAFLPKTQGTQTLLDAAVQPPRTVRYLKGLRGTETSEIETVEKVFLY